MGRVAHGHIRVVTTIQPAPGRLLVASPRLLDPNFYRSVVLLVEHDDDGTLGLVLNRPTESPVGEHLPDWSSFVSDPGVVFIGGPVQPDVGVALARADGSRGLPGARLIDLTAGPDGVQGVVRVFAGYAGWAPGQLASEIEEGGWLVVDAEPADVFRPDPGRLWTDVLRRQPGRISWLANFPQDPRLN